MLIIKYEKGVLTIGKESMALQRKEIEKVDTLLQFVFAESHVAKILSGLTRSQIWNTIPTGL